MRLSLEKTVVEFMQSEMRLSLEKTVVEFMWNFTDFHGLDFQILCL